MTKISFVYFDIGGVFLDWQKAFSGAANAFHRNINDLIAVFDKHSADMTLGKMSPSQLWEIIRFDLKISGGEDFNFLQSWVDDYEPVRSTYDLAIELSSRYKLGIISNIYKGMYLLLEERDIIPKDIFNSVILSCDVGLKKPNIAIYQLAQEKTGVRPTEILFVDDTLGSLIVPKTLDWQIYQYDPLNYENSTRALRNKLLLNVVNE